MATFKTKYRLSDFLLVSMKYLYYFLCAGFGMAFSAVTDFGIFDWQFWLIVIILLLTIITLDYARPTRHLSKKEVDELRDEVTKPIKSKMFKRKF